MFENVEFSRQVLLKRAARPQAAIAIYPESPDSVPVSVTITSTTITFNYASTSLAITYTGESIADIVSNINRSNIPVRAVALSRVTHLENGEFFTITSKLIPYGFDVYDRLSNRGIILRITRHTVKHNTLSRIRLLEPYKDSVTQPWYPVVGIGNFTQEYRGRTFHFGIPEFDNQTWSTRYGKPFKDLKSIVPTVVGSNVFQVPRYPIHFTNNNISFYNGDSLLNSSIIEDIDIYNGKIYVKNGIFLSQDVTLDYTYLENNYVYPHININAHFSQNPALLDKFVLLYAIPTDSSIGIATNRSIFHIVADSLDEAIDSIELDNIDYPIAILGAYNIQQVYASDRAAILDTRSKGGGLIEIDGPKSPVHNIDSIFDTETSEVPIETIAQEAKSFWDIGKWDGQPYPGAAAVLVDLPDDIRDVLPEKDIKNKATKFLAAGVYPVIRYTERELPSTGGLSTDISMTINTSISGYYRHISLGPEILVNTGFIDELLPKDLGVAEYAYHTGLITQYAADPIKNRSISGWLATGTYWFKLSYGPYLEIITGFINQNVPPGLPGLVSTTDLKLTGYNKTGYVIGILDIADIWHDQNDEMFTQTGLSLSTGKNYVLRVRGMGGTPELTGDIGGGIGYYHPTFGIFPIGYQRTHGLNPYVVALSGTNKFAFWNPLSGAWLSTMVSGDNFFPVNSGEVKKYQMTFPTTGFPSGITPTSYSIEFRSAGYGNFVMFDAPSIREKDYQIFVTGAGWNPINRPVQTGYMFVGGAEYTQDVSLGDVVKTLSEGENSILEVSPGSGAYQSYIKSTPYAGIQWDERTKIRFENSSDPDHSLYTSWETKRTLDKRPVPTGQFIKGILSFDSNLGVRQIKNVVINAPYRLDRTGFFADELALELINIHRNSESLRHSSSGLSTVSSYMTESRVRDITTNSKENLITYFGYPDAYKSLYKLGLSRLSGFYSGCLSGVRPAILSGMSNGPNLFKTYHVASGIYYNASGLQTIGQDIRTVVDFINWSYSTSGQTGLYANYYASGLSGLKTIYNYIRSGTSLAGFSYLSPDYYLSGTYYPTPRALTDKSYFNETHPTGSEDHRYTEILPSLAYIWTINGLTSGNMSSITGLPDLINNYYTGQTGRATIALTGDIRILGNTGQTTWYNRFDRYGSMAGQFALDSLETFRYLKTGYIRFQTDSVTNQTNITGAVLGSLITGAENVLDLALSGTQESLCRLGVIEQGFIKLIRAYGEYAALSSNGDTNCNQAKGARYSGIFMTGMKVLLKSMVTTEGNIFETHWVNGDPGQFSKTPPSDIFSAVARGYQMNRDVFIPYAQGLLKTTVANHSYSGSYPYDATLNYVSGGYESKMMPNLVDLYVTCSVYHPEPNITGLLEGRVTE